ncbi:MAG: hypothetical protein ACREP1_14265, partial [Rhodanobacteraceae bacterium]
TLDQVKTAIQPSLDARDAILTADAQRREATNRRLDADRASMLLVGLVINAIKGDPAFGDDSALYEACGYVRRSERKSGLSRKSTTAPQAKAA